MRPPPPISNRSDITLFVHDTLPAYGSGKTSAVASLLQGFVRGGWGAANIVVVDPHGEYARALACSAVVCSVLADDASRPREIGRAHVCTTVTNEHLVCRLLLEKHT